MKLQGEVECREHGRTHTGYKVFSMRLNEYELDTIAMLIDMVRIPYKNTMLSEQGKDLQNRLRTLRKGIKQVKEHLISANAKLKPYPTWVCKPCGILASEEQGAKILSGSTFHDGRCDVCGRFPVAVTEPRDFGYPRFEGHEYNGLGKKIGI